MGNLSATRAVTTPAAIQRPYGWMARGPIREIIMAEVSAKNG